MSVENFAGAVAPKERGRSRRLDFSGFVKHARGNTQSALENPSRSSRRGFMKQSALAAGGLAVQSMLPTTRSQPNHIHVPDIPPSIQKQHEALIQRRMNEGPPASILERAGKTDRMTDADIEDMAIEKSNINLTSTPSGMEEGSTAMERLSNYAEQTKQSLLNTFGPKEALALHPTQDVAEDEVDLIEVNHFYDEQGRLVFDQVIFYEWSPEQNRYHVRAWRLLKSPAQLPRKNWKQGDFLAIWQDGDLLRKVRARNIHETWTQYDPELVEREFLPKEKRRELRKLKVKLAKTAP